MPKRKIVAVHVEDWCSCKDWKEHEWKLSYHALMVYCPFCGKRLWKEKKV